MSKNNKNAKQENKAETKNATNEIRMEQLTGLQNAILAQDANAIRAELANYTPEQISADGRLGFLAQAGNNIIANAERLAALEAKNAELAANQRKVKAEKVEKTALEKMISSGARRAAIAHIIAGKKSTLEVQCTLNALTLLSDETSLKSGAQRQLVLHAGNALEFAKEVRPVSDLPQGIQDAVGDIERVASKLWDLQIGLDDKGQQIADLVEGLEDKSAKSILVELGFEVESMNDSENLIKLKA